MPSKSAKFRLEESVGALASDISNDSLQAAKYCLERLKRLIHFSEGDFSEQMQDIVFNKILSTKRFPSQREIYDVMEEDLVKRAATKEGTTYHGAFLSSRTGCLWASVYHIPTTEFVDALADFISSRNIIGTIIEIGAGNGKLSYGLQQKGIEIIPTDNNSYGLSEREAFVEKIDHADALQKYSPKLVLASWLHPKSGIENDIVIHPSVKEFIKIRNSARTDGLGILGKYMGVDTSGEKTLSSNYEETNSWLKDKIENPLLAKAKSFCVNVDMLCERPDDIEGFKKAISENDLCMYNSNIHHYVRKT